MVMITHKVNYSTRDWMRELSFEGKQLLYEATWSYEPAAQKQPAAEVELYDDTSSFEEHFYEKTLTFAKEVLIHNQIARGNDTNFRQSLMITDHETYYHDIW